MAIMLTGVFFAAAFTLKYMEGWTAAEKLYLTDYLKSGARSQASPIATAKYTLLEGVTATGQRLVIDDATVCISWSAWQRVFRDPQRGKEYR